MVNIKKGLIALVSISLIILIVLFLQDGSKKLEDRKYKDIEKVEILSDKANVNIYKSEDNNVRVVLYGSKKDDVKLIEGTKSIIISYDSGDTICVYKCNKEIDVYVPDNFKELEISVDRSNINVEKLTVNTAKIDSNKGNVSLYKVNNANIINYFGDIFIEEINANNNSYIKTDKGNVEIKKIINLKLDIKTELGSKVVPVIKNEQDYTLKIETNIGNIDIDSHEDKS